MSLPMPSLSFTSTPLLSEADLCAELEVIQAESIGWLPLGSGAYLHQGTSANSDAPVVIHVVGIPDANMAALNILLLV